MLQGVIEVTGDPQRQADVESCGVLGGFAFGGLGFLVRVLFAHLTDIGSDRGLVGVPTVSDWGVGHGHLCP
jgi:hypothetical protein